MFKDRGFISAEEQNYHISPYAYCAGDPVNRIDPDGMAENRDRFGAKYLAYWVYAVNPDKGAGKGARTLQLRFDRDNYRRFLSSYGKIFGAKNSK